MTKDEKRRTDEHLQALGSIEEARMAVKSDPNLYALTLEQVAELYPVSHRTLLRYISDGTLKAVKVGRRYVVTLAALRKFLEHGARDE